MKMTVGQIKENMSFNELLEWVKFFEEREKRNSEDKPKKDFSTPDGIAKILGNG